MGRKIIKLNEYYVIEYTLLYLFKSCIICVHLWFSIICDTQWFNQCYLHKGVYEAVIFWFMLSWLLWWCYGLIPLFIFFIIWFNLMNFMTFFLSSYWDFWLCISIVHFTSKNILNISGNWFTYNEFFNIFLHNTRNEYVLWWLHFFLVCF